jgi:quercetin dioxygenase-like cupin family protein
MTDTTITKIDSTHSPRGEAGQKYLASGTSMSMRLWECEAASDGKTDSKREYETVGYVIKGKAELHIEGQMVLLNAGDSWTVPKGSSHHYKILEPFTAVEATSPPAEVHGRDEGMAGRSNGNGKNSNGKNGSSSSENNSIAEFAEATSVEKSAPAQAKEGVDKTTEVSPMDKGAEDEADGTAPPKNEATAKQVADSKEGKPVDAEPAAKSANDAAGKPAAEAADKATAAKSESKEAGQTSNKIDTPSEDKAANKAKEAENPEAKPAEGNAEAKSDAPQGEGDKAAKEAEAKKVQEAAAQLPRTEGKVTSNAEEKKPEPAEKVEVE